MRCPKWRLLQVYCWTPSGSIEAGSLIRVRNSCEAILQLVVLRHINHSGHFLHWHFSYLSVWNRRALCRKRCINNSRSRHHLLGDLYSARVIYCPIGCSHPGTWRIPISDQSSSCLYQFSHRLLHDWVT